MQLINKKIFSIFIFFFLAIGTGFASSSVEFFASNNTKQINLQTAYERLIGKEQLDLQNSMIAVMQNNHMQQGKFADILGTYQLSGDGNITADNSERFNISPHQQLSNKKVFALAKDLAITLNQESVAVFIPNPSTIVGNITVSFTSHQPTVNEMLNIIHEKLPSLYSQAFSMHLTKKCGGFESATVSEIEWLGSKIHLEDVQKAFPQEKMNYEYGDVFLVFQDGHKEQI